MFTGETIDEKKDWMSRVLSDLNRNRSGVERKQELGDQQKTGGTGTRILGKEEQVKRERVSPGCGLEPLKGR